MKTIIILSAILLLSCSKSKENEYPELPFDAKLYEVNNTGQYVLVGELEGKATDSSTQIFRKIDKIEAVAKDEKTNKQFEEVSVRSGMIDGDETKYTLISSAKLDDIKPEELIVESGGKKYKAGMDIIEPKDEVLYIPFHNCSGKVCEFGIDVVRLKPAADGEMYFSSAETAILIVRDSTGNELYNSSEGMAFAQALQPFQPEQPGETHRYSKSWNGTDKKGSPFTGQRISAEIILPLKPKPYNHKFNLNWPLQ